MKVLPLRHHLEPSYAGAALLALSTAGLRMFSELSRAPSGLAPHILHIFRPLTALACTTSDRRLRELRELLRVISLIRLHVYLSHLHNHTSRGDPSRLRVSCLRAF